MLPDRIRGFPGLRAGVVDRSGDWSEDGLRAVCEECRISQYCRLLGGRSAQGLERVFPGAENLGAIPCPTSKAGRGQVADFTGRLINTIPAATKPAAPRIDQVRDSPKTSAPSPKDRTGVRKENEATVDEG